MTRLGLFLCLGAFVAAVFVVAAGAPAARAAEQRGGATVQQTAPAQPPTGDQGDQEIENDTTEVFTPEPAASESTGVQVPAHNLLQPGAAQGDSLSAGRARPDSARAGIAPADSTRRLAPRGVGPQPQGPRTGAGAAGEEKPAAHRGIWGVHPAAIIVGLIVAHVLIVGLITH